MQRLPVFSGIWDYLTAPHLPSTSLSISETHLALVSLKKKSRVFEPRNLGVLRLPDGLIEPSFTELNVTDEASLIEHLNRAATQAGLKRVRALSAALPAGSARSLVVALESVPGSRQEIEQTIEWKIERTIGHKLADLRVSYSRLTDLNQRPHWIISVVREKVAAQYERIFNQLKWQVGLMAPQHIGEAQWLMRQGIDDDQAVVSLNNRGFDAVIVRGKEPILVREVECDPAERENEFFRFVLFYRDRLLPENAEASINRVLIIGDSVEQSRFRDVMSSALERQVLSLDPGQIGLSVDSNAPFNHFAAAGGLATMAWG